MQIDRINPPELLVPQAHTHVVRVSGGTTLYVSGQGAYDADHRIVGPDDHYEQTKQAFRNVLHALAATGANFRDVVKATYYVVGMSPDALAAFSRAMAEILGDSAEPAPAATLVGVEALGYPEMLVEIDVIAVAG